MSDAADDVLERLRELVGIRTHLSRIDAVLEEAAAVIERAQKTEALLRQCYGRLASLDAGELWSEIGKHLVDDVVHGQPPQ
jgi:hypothetical protein